MAHDLSFKHPITFILRFMNLNRTGYYKWLKHKDDLNIYEQKRAILSFVIKDWHRRFPSYGYHDIAAVMRKQSDLGIEFSDNLIHKCCKFLNIKSKVKHYSYKKPGTQSRIYPNIIKNQWKATKPLEIIVSDMTHIRNKGINYEWTLMVDTFNNEIISSALSRITGDPKPYYKCLEDLLALLKDNKKTAPTILHTDQGAVYHSKAFAKAHENYNIIRSMSRTRTPTDNPIIESLNGWIKAEMACDYQYWSVDNFENFIEEYVHYFNFERPAYCLNYKTPIQYKMDRGF
ncbi:IS3 family transposase [Erysipelothrix rhusiopathiae]|nr:IS3 family transposase [Erysipelothrix rhusiopathiae]